MSTESLMYSKVDPIYIRVNHHDRGLGAMVRPVRVFLYGFPTVGKSTLGRKLASTRTLVLDTDVLLDDPAYIYSTTDEARLQLVKSVTAAAVLQLQRSAEKRDVIFVSNRWQLLPFFASLKGWDVVAADLDPAIAFARMKERQRANPHPRVALEPDPTLEDFHRWWHDPARLRFVQRFARMWITLGANEGLIHLIHDYFPHLRIPGPTAGCPTRYVPPVAGEAVGRLALPIGIQPSFNNTPIY